MKPVLAFSSLFVVLLLAPAASCAQTDSSAPDPSDPVLLSVRKAMSEGGFEGAEKVLSDAIHQFEQSDPKSRQWGFYELVYLGMRTSPPGQVTNPDAEKIATDAIRQLEQENPQSPQLTAALEILSSVLGQKDRQADALTAYQRALDINQAVFGPNDESVVHALIGMSNLIGAPGNQQQREQHLTRALDITRANPEIPDDERVQVWILLAWTYTVEHQVQAAEQMLLQAQQLCAVKHAWPCVQIPSSLADVYSTEGRKADEDAQVLAGYKTFVPADVAQLMVQGLNYSRDKDYAHAEDVSRQAIALLESKPQGDGKNGNQSSGLAFLLGEFGFTLEQEGKYDEAESAFTRQIDLELEGAVGPDGKAKYPMDEGTIFENIIFDELIDACRAAGRLSNAESTIERVLDVQEKLVDERDSSMANTLLALAEVYGAEGEGDNAKYAQALPLYQRALDIRQAALGADDPRTEDVLTPYVDLLRKMHQDAKAAEVQARIDVLTKTQ